MFNPIQAQAEPNFRELIGKQTLNKQRQMFYISSPRLDQDASAISANTSSGHQASSKSWSYAWS